MLRDQSQRHGCHLVRTNKFEFYSLPLFLCTVRVIYGNGVDVEGVQVTNPIKQGHHLASSHRYECVPVVVVHIQLQK